DPEVLRGGVFDIQTQHQERRTIRFGTRRQQQAGGAVGLADHAPGDALVAIQAGQRSEIEFEAVEVERDADVTLEQVVEAPLVARGESRRADERRHGKRSPTSSLTSGLPLRV